MYSLVDGSEASPPVFIGTQANPAYPIWLKKDCTCRLWLTTSVSEPILPFTVGATTACSLWLILERRFAAVTRSHVLYFNSSAGSKLFARALYPSPNFFNKSKLFLTLMLLPANSWRILISLLISFTDSHLIMSHSKPLFASYPSQSLLMSFTDSY
ncbi:hypothetical protein RchiOBHm_Chr3g0480531 [Rosa chinensis]|uniref:Uncharacterized protein n=1 Tax=Rosa chinensis TaxID=74649 RepID=A0A2P6RDR6_ROSCH|nr:hypothetical protein RchiOBHm_Chr3g0480531 [Rosa chinensis]